VPSDPYADWLKIPADRRPPTYYDLLGVPQFSQDVEAIREAAMRRMADVRRYQLGSRSAEAIQLLGELSLAYDTLTTDVRRQQYEQSLQGPGTLSDSPSILETKFDVPLEPPPVVAALPDLDVTAADVVEPPPVQIRLARKAGRAVRKHGPALGAKLARALWWLLYWSGRLTLRLVLEVACLPWRIVRWSDRAMCFLLGRDNTILHNFARLMIVVCLSAAAAVLYPRLDWPTWSIETSAGSALVPGGENGSTVPVAAAGLMSLASSPTANGAAPVESIINSVGMRLVRIPAGEFMMGPSSGEVAENLDEQPHPVRISKPFWMGACEVTQLEYRLVLKADPSSFSHIGTSAQKVQNLDTNGFPVERVSWDEAASFCAALSALPEEAAAGRVYRLPTEAEWEYACRAGTATPFHFDPPIATRANWALPAASNEKSLERTTTVGQFPPNAFGLYDMHGNVAEWCADFYDGGYYRVSPLTDPRNSNYSPTRVVRGGSYLSPISDCRSARRTAVPPELKLVTNGFRVVCELKSP
jgi:formylglycine-generating enzyme required for sulfatase activity